MTVCDKCRHTAIIHQRYSGMHLCGEHFEADVRRKIRESLRRTGLFSRGSRITLGLDGGRQSATLAYVLKNLFSRRRDIEISAVTIDFGENGRYSTSQACAVAKKLDMDCLVVPWQEGQQEAISSEEPFSDLERYDAFYAKRSNILLGSAFVIEASILATGECLDDQALRIFLAYLRGDAKAILAPSFPESPFCKAQERQSPMQPPEERCRSPGRSLPWIRPMQRVPVREARLYAIRHALGFDPVGEGKMQCPPLEAKLLLRRFDSRHPGTYYSLLRGQEKGRRAKPLSVDAK